MEMKCLIFTQIVCTYIGVIAGQSNVHSHGSVTHRHSGSSLPVHTHPNLPQKSAPVPGNPNIHRHGSITHSHSGSSAHAHPNLPPNFEPVHGNSNVHTHGSVTHSHSQGSTIHSHRNLPRNVQQDMASTAMNQFNGFPPFNPDWLTPQEQRIARVRQIPSYILAGGADCNAQCRRGRAVRSCACARFMCYYQGCSASCSLLREGSFIRASCQQFVGGPYHKTGSTSTVSKCLQPIDPGSCQSRLYSRYGYNSQTQKCERFYYSGCSGNDNRFTTRNACRQACT